MSDENEHPDPYQWWFHRRVMCYMGILGLVGLAFVAIIFPVPAASAEILKYAGMGCSLLIVQYMGSSACDIIKSWKGQ